MTFAEMLRIMEDHGPLTDGQPSDWSQERKNGIEFFRKGIRSSYSTQDGTIVPEKKLRRTAKDLYLGKSSKSAK